MKKWMKFLVLVAALASVPCFAGDCKPRLVEGKLLGTDATAAIKLSTEWDNDKILKYLGLKVSDATIEKSSGVDGSSTTYRFTTAAVIISDGFGGRVVLYSSKDKAKDVVWRLDSC